MLALLGAVILWCSIGTDTGSPCGLCQDKGSLVCHRCEGKGLRAVSCARCGGDRKLTCPARRCDEGRFLCPACDGAREIAWEGGQKDPCRFCAQKGFVRCPYCKGERKLGCPDCKGEGKLLVPCSACLGLKRFPCPLSRESSPCAACGGNRSFACHECRGVGRFDERCKDCLGFNLLLCDCAGGQVICNTCYGSGRLRKVLVNSKTAAGSSKCPDCGTRGAAKCTDCGGGGVVPCKKTPPVEDCARCDDGRIACPRCAK